MRNIKALVTLPLLIVVAASCASPGSSSTGAPLALPADVPPAQPTSNTIQTVFLIVMENHNWSEVDGSKSAPYLNGLLTVGAHAEKYMNPPGLHPSEPNYIWLESGQSFGVATDDDPALNHIASPDHLTRQLYLAGIPWRSYQEAITGTDCPLDSEGEYAAKHNPVVFFDDMTGARDANSALCIAHNRPFAELSGDLASGNVARYNFITPNLCDDMHDSCGPQNNTIKQGDDWLAHTVPMIMASEAYKHGGLILITWDEGEGSDGPIGLVALSPDIKPGYSNHIAYTHSSTLRTVQEIFELSPFLGDAANASDLSDLFMTFP